MQTIIRLRNRQVFNQSTNGSWSFRTNGKNEVNINDLLKKGNIVSFVGNLCVTRLETVNAPGLIVRSVYSPGDNVVIHEGEKEVNELVERLIRANGKAIIEFVA